MIAPPSLSPLFFPALPSLENKISPIVENRVAELDCFSVASHQSSGTDSIVRCTAQWNKNWKPLHLSLIAGGGAFQTDDKYFFGYLGARILINPDKPVSGFFNFDSSVFKYDSIGVTSIQHETIGVLAKVLHTPYLKLNGIAYLDGMHEATSQGRVFFNLGIAATLDRFQLYSLFHFLLSTPTFAQQNIRDLRPYLDNLQFGAIAFINDRTNIGAHVQHNLIGSTTVDLSLTRGPFSFSLGYQQTDPLLSGEEHRVNFGVQFTLPLPHSLRGRATTEAYFSTRKVDPKNNPTYESRAISPNPVPDQLSGAPSFYRFADSLKNESFITKIVNATLLAVTAGVAFDDDAAKNSIPQFFGKPHLLNPEYIYSMTLRAIKANQPLPGLVCGDLAAYTEAFLKLAGVLSTYTVSIPYKDLFDTDAPHAFVITRDPNTNNYYAIDGNNITQPLITGIHTSLVEFLTYLQEKNGTVPLGFYIIPEGRNPHYWNDPRSAVVQRMVNDPKNSEIINLLLSH